MGLVYARIKLSNEAKPDLRPVEIDALVDSGAASLCIPDIVQRELQLETKRMRMAELADGTLVEVEVVAPVGISFENRYTVSMAMVVGNEVLLGAVPMQDMDVLIDPKAERLILPPERPNFALSKVK